MRIMALLLLASVKLYVHHVVYGVKKLEAVVRKLHVPLLALPDVVVLLPFHISFVFSIRGRRLPCP